MPVSVLFWTNSSQFLMFLLFDVLSPQEAQVNALPPVWITGTAWPLLYDMQENRHIFASGDDPYWDSQSGSSNTNWGV